MALFDITDKDVIRALTDLYEQGEAADMPLTDADVEYELKFYSPDWPQIYMNLSCLQYGEDMYLYDNAAHRGIAVGDLLDGYFADGAQP